MFRKLMTLLVVPAVLGAQQMTDTTFHVISLADAVHLATENNVQAITAVNAIRSANNQVRAARAAFIPTLSANAGQSKSAGERLGQSGTLVPYASVWQFNTGLTTNLTLFDGGKMFADVASARANVAASQASEVNTAASLELQVKEQYNAVLSANEEAAAADAQMALAQQELGVSIAQVNAGAANVADSLNSVVVVGNAKLAILTAEQDLRTASAALTRLIGTPYLVTANPADTLQLPTAPLDSAELMGLALNGPGIKQVQSQLAADEAARRSAKAAYLPTLSASGSFTGNGTGNAYGLSGANPYPYTRGISLTVSYPIFNRFTRENTIATAEINLENSQAQLHDQQLAAEQTVIVQIGLLRDAQEKVQVQQASVAASEEALRVNQQRYSLGAGTMVDVLTSESNLIAARQGLIGAELSERNAKAEIEAAIGRDLP